MFTRRFEDINRYISDYILFYVYFLKNRLNHCLEIVSY